MSPIVKLDPVPAHALVHEGAGWFTLPPWCSVCQSSGRCDPFPMPEGAVTP